ncbi:unnamed protein product [Caenorhabditis auriculariae]|uniref:Endonuclease/exonuclease/phosphatase domain-containing protein n=1 Tax=Caenorhabditis auriculariae TaxID=2777116 RepID=A0A8S1HXF8_9PELO|nr:unnamed protein product [Caenorhabditis auriculariae]
MVRSFVGTIVGLKYRLKVQRYDDRVMKIVFLAEGRKLHFICAYAPQLGCSAKSLEYFWDMLDNITAEASLEDYLIYSGDLNTSARKRSNEESVRNLEYRTSHEAIVANTMFTKRESYIKTFYSTRGQTQIDYITIRRADRCAVLGCKALAYETVAPQHRLLLADLRIAAAKKIR